MSKSRRGWWVGWHFYAYVAILISVPVLLVNIYASLAGPMRQVVDMGNPSVFPNGNPRGDKPKSKAGLNASVHAVGQAVASTQDALKPRRIIAIGDIHGDLEAFKRALRLAGVIEGDGSIWAGGQTTVVQIGDLITGHGPGDRAVFDYTCALQQEASRAGGALYVVLGDHDVSNWQHLYPNTPWPKWMMFMVELQHTLFVHGSLLLSALAEGGSLDNMNLQVANWLRIGGRAPKWFEGPNSPMWSRAYSEDENQVQPRCAELKRLLELLALRRMVVGHTVRVEGISAVCGRTAWRIDVGLAGTESSAGIQEASQILEIVGEDEVHVLGLNEARMPRWSAAHHLPSPDSLGLPKAVWSG